MPKIKINDINLYYESHGQGFPIIFTHGFTASHAMWQPQVSVLSKEYRFITYDARGHAESDSPPSSTQYSADISVEDLYQLTLALDIKKAVIGGLSMGGYISLRFGLKHPEVTSALIIMDTGPGYRNPARMQEWNNSQEVRAKRLETEGIGFMLAEKRTEASREIMLKHNPIGLANMGRNVVAQHDSWVIENLDKIKVPSLIIVGAKDTPFIAAAEYMEKTISGAERVIIPDAGHASNMENPDFFNKSLLDFLHSLNLPGV